MSSMDNGTHGPNVAQQTCRHCGYALASAAKFCSTCGQGVDEKPSSNEAPASVSLPPDDRPKQIPLLEKMWALAIVLAIAIAASQLDELFGLLKTDQSTLFVIGMGFWAAWFALWTWILLSVTRSRRRWAKWVFVAVAFGSIATSLRHPEASLQLGAFTAVMYWLQLGVLGVCTYLLFTPAVGSWLRGAAIVATAPQLEPTSSDAPAAGPINAVPMPQRSRAIPPTQMNARNQRYGGLVALLVSIVILIALDHFNGQIFPDDWYCIVGAGKVDIVPGQTRPNSWTTSNGCGGSRMPECATSWIHTPASSFCHHGTLWDAISLKVGNSLDARRR